MIVPNFEPPSLVVRCNVALVTDSFKRLTVLSPAARLTFGQPSESTRQVMIEAATHDMFGVWVYDARISQNIGGRLQNSCRYGEIAGRLLLE